jgi:putative ABC transport system permease protein
MNYLVKLKILSLNEIINAFREFIGLIIISIGFMVIMGGVLGFAIIFTATSMNISERTREFSSLRVMGFSKGEIYSIVTKENFLMSISGILMGIPLGNIFLDSIDKAFSNDLYTLNLTPDLSSYFLAAIVTIAFIVLAQLATKKKIDKLDFLEALKNRVV